MVCGVTGVHSWRSEKIGQYYSKRSSLGLIKEAEAGQGFRLRNGSYSSYIRIKERLDNTVMFLMSRHQHGSLTRYATGLIITTMAKYMYNCILTAQRLSRMLFCTSGGYKYPPTHAESSLNDSLVYTIKGKGEAPLWVSQISHSFKVTMTRNFFWRKYLAYHVDKPIPIKWKISKTSKKLCLWLSFIDFTASCSFL